MALIKIYSERKNLDELRIHVANSIKLVASAALNVQGVETTPGNVETVCIEGLDLIGIDFICEIIAVRRPDEQAIADNFIAGLNQIYPDKLFSVYFVHIDEVGMSNTPRPTSDCRSISMNEAVLVAKKYLDE